MKYLGIAPRAAEAGNPPPAIELDVVEPGVDYAIEFVMTRFEAKLEGTTFYGAKILMDEDHAEAFADALLAAIKELRARRLAPL